MLIYRTLPTTPRLDERIHKVAASLHGRLNGEDIDLARGGKAFRYSRNEESTALDQEYFTNVWPNLLREEKEVKLEPPKHNPTILRFENGFENGWLSTSPNEVGIIIPIRDPDDMFKEDRIYIKSAGGECYHDLQLAPRTMVELSGDVRFWVSNRVPFDLILHPTSPIRKVEPATVEGT